LTWTYCPKCLEKEREIYDLKAEIVRLKAQLRYRERTAQEGFFGSSTPSSKVPVKANARPEDRRRRGGARRGHRGHGRASFSVDEADRVETVRVGERCPHCRAALESRGFRARSVLDLPPVKAQKVILRLERRRCPRCRRILEAKAPPVLPRCLLSTRLMAHVAVQHYGYGAPLGRLEDQLGMGHGTLVYALHQLRRWLKHVPDRLLPAYRSAPVKHADETGWRRDGQGGYAWLYCTPDLSLYRFRQTRSAQVPREVLGPAPLPGVLVVDRYSAYNKAPCLLQYCYAHLHREVTDLEKKFPEAPEVRAFVKALAPRLAQAMKLRSRTLTPRQFRHKAARLQRSIQGVIYRPARHPAVWNIQDLFRTHKDRLYHWTKDPNIPADNHRAERELRPLVIARKISFGSQSDAGAQTRETLMTILHTLKKRVPDMPQAFTEALDTLAQDPSRDPYAVLFPPDSS
jgi:transposase